MLYKLASYAPGDNITSLIYAAGLPVGFSPQEVINTELKFYRTSQTFLMENQPNVWPLYLNIIEQSGILGYAYKKAYLSDSLGEITEDIIVEYRNYYDVLKKLVTRYIRKGYTFDRDWLQAIESL